MSGQAWQGGLRRVNGVNTDSQTAKEKKDRVGMEVGLGWLGIEELSDVEGERRGGMLGVQD